MEPRERRLRILGEYEIEALYALPHFSDDERPEYFSLSPTEKRALFQMFFFSSRRRHTIWNCDWSSDVCSSDLHPAIVEVRKGGDPDRGGYLGGIGHLHFPRDGRPVGKGGSDEAGHPGGLRPGSPNRDRKSVV